MPSTTETTTDEELHELLSIALDFDLPVLERRYAAARIAGTMDGVLTTCDVFDSVRNEREAA